METSSFPYVCFSGGRNSSNGVHSSGKEFAPRGANFFLEKLTPFEKENSRSASSEIYQLIFLLFITLISSILAVFNALHIPLPLS